MKVLASVSSKCLAALTHNRRISSCGSLSTPTLGGHQLTHKTRNILHYPPFGVFYSPSLKINAFCVRHSSLQMFAFRVAGCSQSAFPRALVNSLGWFQLPGMDPTLSIHLLLFCELWCHLQSSFWIGRCITPRDTVFIHSIYIFCRVLHTLDHTHRFRSALLYFGFPYSLSYVCLGVFVVISCFSVVNFHPGLIILTLDNEVGY